MATTINWDNVAAFTDEMSFTLISKAVLQTNVSEYLTLKSGLRSGTTAINLLDADISVDDRACGWNEAGSLTYSQVDITMDEKQTKQTICPQDLRDYYVSQQLSAGAVAEELPFEEVISDLFVKKIKEYNENAIANKVFTAITVANGAADSGQTVASTADTIYEDVLDLIDAVPAKADRFENKAVLMSPLNFKRLRRALVAANLYHFDPSNNNDMVLEIPGTDYIAVKGTFSGSAGTVSGDAMIAGPMEAIVYGVGLEDDFDTLRIFYSQDNDEVRVMGAWRMGIGVSETDLFARNGTL
jgi:hypothetical protein